MGKHQQGKYPYSAKEKAAEITAQPEQLQKA
jgi:hypothetical protein